jgi:hypothetical protein
MRLTKSGIAYFPYSRGSIYSMVLESDGFCNFLSTEFPMSMRDLPGTRSQHLLPYPFPPRRKGQRLRQTGPFYNVSTKARSPRDTPSPVVQCGTELSSRQNGVPEVQATPTAL